MDELGALAADYRSTEKISKFESAPMWTVVKKMARTDEHVDALRRRLAEWSDRHNLTDDWLLDEAIRSLHNATFRRVRSAVRRRRLQWAPGVAMQRPALPRDVLRFEFREEDAWQPTEESHSDAEARLELKLRNALSEYFDLVRAKLREAGYQRAPEKMQFEHFRWLVEYQVVGLSQREIAQRNNTDRSGVSKAIAAIAELAGIRLREASKGGAPRKGLASDGEPRNSEPLVTDSE